MDIGGERAAGTPLRAANWADVLEPLENFSYPAARLKDVELEGRDLTGLDQAALAQQLDDSVQRGAQQ
jgi:hypothetical protein